MEMTYRVQTHGLSESLRPGDTVGFSIDASDSSIDALERGHRRSEPSILLSVTEPLASSKVGEHVDKVRPSTFGTI
jgi:hypothetical protein